MSCFDEDDIIMWYPSQGDWLLEANIRAQRQRTLDQTLEKNKTNEQKRHAEQQKLAEKMAKEELRKYYESIKKE